MGQPAPAQREQSGVSAAHVSERTEREERHIPVAGILPPVEDPLGLLMRSRILRHVTHRLFGPMLASAVAVHVPLSVLGLERFVSEVSLTPGRKKHFLESDAEFRLAQLVNETVQPPAVLRSISRSRGALRPRPEEAFDGVVFRGFDDPTGAHDQDVVEAVVSVAPRLSELIDQAGLFNR